MADFVFFGHGGRGEGTAQGTYVVPPNCTIRFFEKDGQLLNMAGAGVLLDWLLRDNPLVAQANAEVVQSFGQYETVPDYEITGDANAAAACQVPATGIYIVGRPKANGPAITLATGLTRRLSALVGSKAKSALGMNIYWMCCRNVKSQINSNKPTARTTATTVSTGQAKAREHVISDVGLKPSEVLARGGLWR